MQEKPIHSDKKSCLKLIDGSTQHLKWILQTEVAG